MVDVLIFGVMFNLFPYRSKEVLRVVSEVQVVISCLNMALSHFGSLRGTHLNFSHHGKLSKTQFNCLMQKRK